MVIDMRNNVDKIGVNAVQSIVYKELHWIFREQPIEDYGIDALIEIDGVDYPTGKYIAVQIKSGKSFFSEITKNGVIFRFDQKHKKYWVEHSLPVILVLYHPENEECIWETIDRITVKPVSEKTYKLTVPSSNRFDMSAKGKLLILAYSKNIGDLANNVEDLNVDSQSLLALMDDNQKKTFLRARTEFNKKNASAAHKPLNDTDEISHLITAIRKANQRNCINDTPLLLNQLYVGQSFIESYKRVEEFISSSNTKTMIIWGSAGIGKSTLVRMVTEKHKNDILLIEMREIFLSKDFANALQAIYENYKSNNIKVIIIDGWDEQTSQQNRFHSWQSILEWQNQHKGIKVIITSRIFNEYVYEGIDIFEMQPFSQSEAIYFLKAITGKDFTSKGIMPELTSIYNTPLLLKMLAVVSYSHGMPLEKFTIENLLFSLTSEYSNEQIIILEQLAFKMMQMGNTIIKIENTDELCALNQYKELSIDNEHVAFVHKILYEFFAAKYIFRRAFQEVKSPTSFEKEVWNMFAHNSCSVEVLDYLKIIIKHYITLDDIYVKQLSSNFSYMLEHGMVSDSVDNIEVFKAVSNVFYVVWHVVSYVNRLHFGGFQPQISEKGEVNLICLINLFNKIYFSKMYLDFSCVDLSGVKLWRGNLININFKKTKLCYANLLGSCLEGSNLEQSDLSYCNLVATDLRHSNLRDVVLTGAKVSHCMISEDSLQYFLPYKDTIPHLDKLIVFMNDGSIARFAEF